MSCRSPTFLSRETDGDDNECDHNKRHDDENAKDDKDMPSSQVIEHLSPLSAARRRCRPRYAKYTMASSPCEESPTGLKSALARPAHSSSVALITSTVFNHGG
jgi:hypothetical protein